MSRTHACEILFSISHDLKRFANWLSIMKPRILSDYLSKTRAQILPSVLSTSVSFVNINMADNCINSDDDDMLVKASQEVEDNISDNELIHATQVIEQFPDPLSEPKDSDDDLPVSQKRIRYDPPVSDVSEDEDKHQPSMQPIGEVSTSIL